LPEDVERGPLASHRFAAPSRRRGKTPTGVTVALALASDSTHTG